MKTSCTCGCLPWYLYRKKMSVLTSSVGEDDCDFTVVFSRSAVGFKEGDCWVGVARFGRVTVTACLCFFESRSGWWQKDGSFCFPFHCFFLVFHNSLVVRGDHFARRIFGTDWGSRIFLFYCSVRTWRDMRDKRYIIIYIVCVPLCVN